MPKKKLKKEKKYIARVMPCLNADLYAVCIIDQAKPLVVQSVVSTHIRWVDADSCRAFVQRQLKIWARDGLMVGSTVVWIRDPAIPARRWAPAMRIRIKAANIHSEIGPFTSISALKEEAQLSLSKIKHETAD